MARSDWLSLGSGYWVRKDDRFHAFKLGSRYRRLQCTALGGNHWRFQLLREAMDYADTHYPMEREG